MVIRPVSNLTMPILALACDYDETLAAKGQIAQPTVQALVRLKRSGGKLVVVTGRRLGDLLEVCPEIHLFDSVVAENGAVMYQPSTGRMRPLADKPPERFLNRLREHGVRPLAAGRSIVATVQQHHEAVRNVIAEMGLDFEIIFNRESLMILPSGINKATGLSLALEELQVPAGNVVGVGDAENDAAFLEMCGFSVAVANAIPSIKEAADMVTGGNHGAGVVEVINKVIAEGCLRIKAPAPG
jgi:hydroxymethylpyrimidine pyrophosphatase-like HAD family hydrolase